MDYITRMYDNIRNTSSDFLQFIYNFQRELYFNDFLSTLNNNNKEE